MDYMTRTAPFGRGLMCDFFRHLESEMHWRALAKGKSVAKDMPRVETFSDSTIRSSRAGFAIRTRSGILMPNRSAKRRSV
jgi:hypothetical protein